MKTLMMVLALALTTNAMATGGFDCYNKDKTVEISGSTGHMTGNPLIDQVYLKNSGQESSYARINAVGYWNMGKHLKLAVLDKDFMEFDILLEAKKSPFSDYFVGTATLKGDKKVRVKCELY